MTQRYFLCVSNVRTGSSLVATSLNELPGIATDYEIKWKPTYDPQPIHLVMRESGWNCCDALASIAPDASIVGSRLVFDFLSPIDRDDIATILDLIDRDIAIIHITRRYFDIILSEQRRGAINVLNRSPSSVKPDTVMNQTLIETTQRLETVDLEDSHRSKRSLDELKGAAVDLFQHDLVCKAIADQAHAPMHVEYDSICDRLHEVASLIGYEGEPRLVDDVLKGTSKNW